MTNNKTDNRPLRVYKASAGSGKTFTLAAEYIKLLIRNPQCYRNILAVTFTNKATEEMKKRILSQLYGIWMNLDDSQKYMDVICNDLDASREFVSRQAGTALRLLMHNYSYFRVETIDSFFQSVLRNLARELDLTPNLRLELNDSQVEEQAVNDLIEELDINNDILLWIISYIKEKISDDKSWNVIGQIKNFGRTIFQDFYKKESDALNVKAATKGFFPQYIKRLKQERDDAEKHMRDYADAFFDTLNREGLAIEDLAYGKSGAAGFFTKLNNGIFDESIVSKRITESFLKKSESWYSKKSQKAELINCIANNELMPILQNAINDRPKQWRRYKSAELTLRHLHQLRLLGSIESKVRELNEDANRFLLSDTQHLLHSLINGSDSPFIFEKIGTRIEHVMIDEFQDTSSVQWQNFKVLLLECMSHEDTHNLIVGDVKQSIYRWRSGDWRLLNGISSQFSEPDAQLDIRTLATNYRSQANVIRFNNTFFRNAAEQEYKDLDGDNEESAMQLKSAYADVEQTIPAGRTDNGYVSVTLLPADEYQEQTLNELVAIVRRLSDCGISPSGIAILVRTNNYIPIIAKHFMENMPETRIVSDEAFRLEASVSVGIIIMALRLLTHQDDKLAKANLVTAYQHYVQKRDLADNGHLLEESALDSLLPEEYVNGMERLQAVPLYDLAERLFSIFHLHEIADQSAYLCAFYDHLSAFTQDCTPDIDAFLDEWESHIRRKTIQSDAIDGIRLISIHKSKGLEFDNVIIPFCDWQLEKPYGNVLWCRPECEPFNELPIVPIDYSKKGMTGTIYEKDYHSEHLQNCVDNLNLLYVAFTRAGHNLFVIGKRDATNSRSSLIQTCLSLVKNELDGATLNAPEDKDQPISFEYGKLSDGDGNTVKSTSNVFLQPVDAQKVEVMTFGEKTEFKQSNQSRDFISGRDDGNDTQQDEYIKTGCVLHSIFSEIQTAGDIDNAIERMRCDGIIDDGASVRIRTMLDKRLADKRVADWFSGRWNLYNECTILSVDKETGEVKERRPDRVMTDGGRMIVVDFKFGVPRDEYYAQVHEYMSLLKAMGHRNVEGYLWFVYSNKIEKIL